jgi:tetratricopeptide (TPR) repeat protein
MARKPADPDSAPARPPRRTRKPAAKRAPRKRTAAPAARKKAAATTTSAPAAPEKPAAARPKLTLPGVGAASTRLRTVMLNFAFLGAFLLLVPVIASQFWRSEVLIDRIPVPAALSDLGLSADVAASRLWDGLRDATALAGHTSKQSVTAIPSADRVEFTLPESGFSMESLIQQTRQFFNAYQTRIGGEFTCADAACERAGIRLRLRVVTDRPRVVDLPPLGDMPLRDYFQLAGIQVLTVLDPVIAAAAIEHSDPDRAMVLARNLVRQAHPDAKWAQLVIGRLKAATDPAGAIAAYEAALALDPAFVGARTLLLGQLIEVRRLDEARRQAEILERHAPDERAALIRLAELARVRGELDEADAIVARGSRLYPNDPFFPTLLADVWTDRGKPDEARAALERALELDPAFSPALNSLGIAYVRAGEMEKAEPIFAAFLEFEPGNIDATLLYAAALQARGAFAEAVAKLREVEPLAPGNAALLLQTGSALLQLNQTNEAAGYVRRVIALDDGNADAHALLGRLLMMTASPTEAIGSYRRAVELAPDNLDILDAAAFCYSLAGDLAEAIRLSEAVLATDPGRFTSLFALGNYLALTGNRDAAIAAYEQFLAVAPPLEFLDASRQLARDSITRLAAEGPAS